MKLDWINIVFLLGALQGGVFLIGINLKHPFTSACKQSLSALLLTIIVAMVYYLSWVNEWSVFFPYINFLGSAAWMAICPIYLMLTKTFIYPNYTLKKHHLLWLTIPLLFCIEGVLNVLGIEYGIFNWLKDPEIYMDIWFTI